MIKDSNSLKAEDYYNGTLLAYEGGVIMFFQGRCKWHIHKTWNEYVEHSSDQSFFWIRNLEFKGLDRKVDTLSGKPRM